MGGGGEIENDPYNSVDFFFAYLFEICGRFADHVKFSMISNFTIFPPIIMRYEGVSSPYTPLKTPLWYLSTVI